MAEGQFRVTGLKEQIKAMEERAKRAKNLEPALKVTAQRFQALIDRSFSTSTSPSGEPWQALAPRTVARKQRKGYSAQPLIRRGARGLQGQTTAEATQDGLRFASLPGYGIYHQSAAPRRRLPQREFLPLRIGSGSVALMSSPQVRSILDDMSRRIVRWIKDGKR